MVIIQPRYGQLHIQGAPRLADPNILPLTLPVDMLLLLGSNQPADVARAKDWLQGWDLELFAGGPPQREDSATWRKKRRQGFFRRVGQWRRAGVPALFLRAARRASEGRFTSELGAHLARVRFGVDGDPEPSEVKDFLALAAWCLLWALLRGDKFEVRACALCGQPFLAGPRARYCQRPAPYTHRPGGDWATCQNVAKLKTYRAKKRGVPVSFPFSSPEEKTEALQAAAALARELNLRSAEKAPAPARQSTSPREEPKSKGGKSRGKR
jgi:hypothetical protein